MLRGEAGIGKTALLEQARDMAVASGCRVESSAGVEAEAQFAFAGLHQLCHPMLDRLAALPDPQQTALGVAFGLRTGPAPDRFLVGLATLTLMAEVAEETPLVCLVDDAQWLDEASAQVLAFVARRVSAERVALLFGLRDAGTGAVGGEDGQPFAGLPALQVDGLGEDDASGLLTSAVSSSLDEDVRSRILAEARGNPLALLELPHDLQLPGLPGGYELPGALRLPRRIEDGFRRRSASLPAEAQLLLLVASAEPTGEPALLWRAAAHLGLDHEAAAPAEQAGLLEIDTRVRFRHPLVRSAIYQASPPRDRRRVHGALAAATDPQSDPDRCAWHRAQAVLGADETVAAELERSADRARARGGLAAAAAFLRRAVELTPDPATRAARALDAAHSTHAAGASASALELLSVAAAGPPDDLRQARLALLRAQIAFRLTRGSEVPEMLLDAADQLVPLDAALAREAYVEAIEASFHAGRFAPLHTSRDIAVAAQEVALLGTSPRPIDLLLDGLATRFTRGYEASVPSLERALEAFVDDDSGSDDDHGRWLWLACHVGAMLWDDEKIVILAGRAVRLAREAGALATLPASLNALGLVLVLTGELGRAAELSSEEEAITRATGAPPIPNARLNLAAWRGEQPEALELLATTVEGATARGEGLTLSSADASLAYLHNGLGNYDKALAAAGRLYELDELAHSSVALPELVEAAVRADDRALATAALDRLVARAEASGTEWALGMAARSRALVSSGPRAEESYREAIERLARCRMATHLARAHLVYGEWLRREGRRRDAREELRTAHEQLSDMGAGAFAERAARELRATGEHARERTAQPTDALTAQEAHIARLVATGATSREVASRLFLSPRTIEAHLRSIYRKLGISSRRELRDLRLP